MTARRSKPEGTYPNLSVRDVLRDGHVLLLRNPAGRKFGRKDAIRIDSGWTDFDDIPSALARVQEEEKVRAADAPPAWDPEFGYLSPDPSFCGNNLFVTCMVHLEALFLLGDIKYVLAGLGATRITYWGFEAENIRDTAHIYRLENRHSLGLSAEALVQRIATVYQRLVQQEINARLHLVEDDPRLLCDAISRALGVLRSARLLSPWELADILSPIRMAASMGLIDGVTKEEIDDFTLNQFDEPLDDIDSREQERARDKRDADLADRINKRFAHVGLNATGRRLLES